MANGIVLNIDTTKSEFQNPMVQLRQGDGNYQSLDVTVTSNGEPFDLTGWTTTFMGTTAGGFKIVDSAVMVTNAVQGEFTYTPTKSWGQDQGEFKNAYFKFTKADETASGASFRVNVLDAVDLTAEEAGNYISIIDQTIIKLDSDLSALQTSVDDLKAQNNAIKTTDNIWTGTNTFNKKIIAPVGVQGNSDTATKLQTARRINGTLFDGTADINVNAANDSNLVHTTGDEIVAGFKKFSGNIATTSDNSMINGGGINGDLAMVKRVGYPAHLALGNINFSFVVKRSNKNAVSPSDTFTDMFTVNIDGTVRAGTQQYLVPLDKDVLHNTGTETVAGNKTFTGSTNFTQPIQGNLNGNATTANTANDPNAAKLSADNSFTGANIFTGKTTFWFKQIQWTSGIMQGTWYIQRIGNWVNAKFDMSANIGTGTTTLSLPVGYRPLSQFVRELEQGDAGISQNGTVLLANSYTGSNAMTFSYPTNDVWPTA